MAAVSDLLLMTVCREGDQVSNACWIHEHEGERPGPEFVIFFLLGGRVCELFSSGFGAQRSK